MKLLPAHCSSPLVYYIFVGYLAAGAYGKEKKRKETMVAGKDSCKN